MIEARQALVRAPEIERCAETPLQRYAHILENREVWKDRAYLERPHNAASGNIRRLFSGDIVAQKEDFTRSRLQKFGQQIEESRLAGAVRTDEGVDFSPPHTQRHAVDRNESLERLDQIARLENRALG